MTDSGNEQIEESGKQEQQAMDGMKKLEQMVNKQKRKRESSSSGDESDDGAYKQQFSLGSLFSFGDRGLGCRWYNKEDHLCLTFSRFIERNGQIKKEPYAPSVSLKTEELQEFFTKFNEIMQDMEYTRTAEKLRIKEQKKFEKKQKQQRAIMYNKKKGKFTK